MTESDAVDALWLLGSKYPAWALVQKHEAVPVLMSEQGREYLKMHLPDWAPPSEQK